MRVGACAVGVLDEDVQVVLAVHQDLVLDHSAFLEVLELGEGELVVVQLEHSLRFLAAGRQPAQHQGFVLGHSHYRESPEWDGQLQLGDLHFVLGEDVAFDAVEHSKLLVVPSADEYLIVVDPAGCGLAPRHLQVGNRIPLPRYNVIVLSRSDLGLTLAVVSAKDEHLLVVVDRGEEVAEGGHLHLVHHQLLVVEHSEVVVGRPAEQIVLVVGRDEDH